jgi:hypothetical protein
MNHPAYDFLSPPSVNNSFGLHRQAVPERHGDRHYQIDSSLISLVVFHSLRCSTEGSRCSELQPLIRPKRNRQRSGYDTAGVKGAKVWPQVKDSSRSPPAPSLIEWWMGEQKVWSLRGSNSRPWRIIAELLAPRSNQLS